MRYILINCVKDLNYAMLNCGTNFRTKIFPILCAEVAVYKPTVFGQSYVHIVIMNKLFYFV